MSGDPFNYGGYDNCWNYIAPNGDEYIVADTDGDGKPDSVVIDEVGSGGDKPQPPVNPGEGGPDTGDDGNNPPSGGGVAQVVGPRGKLSKGIFSSKSELTLSQWTKVEKALNDINKDCMGGRLIGKVFQKNILLVHDPNLASAHGKYFSSTNKLVIRDFEEKELNESIERTLVHELIHSVQGSTTTGMLNHEIEAHVEVYKYAKRTKRIPVNGKKYNKIPFLLEVLDENYNILDINVFREEYLNVMQDLKDNGYANYSESIADRNFNTVKELSKDC